MSDGSRDGTVEPQSETAALPEPPVISACPRCGTKMPASRPAARCPVCQLRDALDPAVESNPMGIGLRAASPDEPAAAWAPNRFDHYEVITRDNGTPIELGHGAMGVTYRAI